MKFNVKEINDKYDFEITAASFIGNPMNNTVMFITKKLEKSLGNLEGINNCLIFIDENIDVPEKMKEKNCFVFSNNPQAEYADFAVAVASKEQEDRKKRKYTLTSDGYYIGENVVMGENVTIEPMCLIDHDVVIGNNARIGCGSVIRNAVIGDDFTCYEHVVIGTDCFFIAEEDGKDFRIPSFGKVIIGNNVDLSSNVVIERGFNSDTELHDYVKLDSDVLIGHDDKLGEHVKITCGANLAGFVTVEEHGFVGMNATIRQRTTIRANASVGMGAVVGTNVKEGVTVFGNPAKKISFES